MTNSSRKAGAPLGNINAVKHGFYASKYHRNSLVTGDDDQLRKGRLDDEVALIRLLLCRIASLLADNPKMELKEYLDANRGILMAVTRLESLYRHTIIIHDEVPDMDAILARLNALSISEDDVPQQEE